MLLSLRIEPGPEEDLVTRVWLGPLCVGVTLSDRVPNSALEKVAAQMAYAFTTYGQEKPEKLPRRDAGPRRMKRWAEENRWWFDDKHRRDRIAHDLIPFITTALQNHTQVQE
jgi:hypothetical protein